MESTTEIDQLKAKATDNPVLYTATGWVAGIYQPSPDKFYQGVLVTQDGQEFGAELFCRLRNQLKRKHPGYATQPDFFLEPARWMVYPSTDPLRFRLVIMKPLHSEKSGAQESGAEPGEKKKLDSFRMVGEIESCVGGIVTICIRRNEQPRKGQSDDPEYQPFVLTLVGSVVPPEAVGQIWELEARRFGKSLVVAAGRPYEPSTADLASIEKQQKHHSIALKATGYGDKAAESSSTPLPSPIIKSKPPGQTEAKKQAEQPVVDATNAPSKSEAVLSTPVAKKVPDSTAKGSNPNTALTSGKMEVVVKLNQFPDDVRTVDKGWLEFVVDTGEALVTITVKPKVFAALEQAQLDYPDWVAAISGQMGDRTATGFRLESPQIKIFERKAKDTLPSEPIPRPANSEPSSATSIQPSPPGGMQKKQAKAQPVGDPQKTPPAVANPMQRSKEHLQQQRPSKAPPHRGQKQPDDNVPPVGKQLSRDPKSLLGSQTTAASQNSQQSQKARFTVTIDGRVFSGSDSVTLNRRKVCIDGKLVGQAKMVVVLGQPRTMEADGGVSQGQNQAVLTSR